ncbi:MAG TPA: hypothetical protein VMK12_31265, partial [Anaeromyxobacteraceae bacterium]|nr:hypothetical protein [Anaeromyxobacteraceae bacterium]
DPPTHYERDGEQVTRSRLEALYDKLAEAVCSRDLTELGQYAGHIGLERFKAGFDLSEVQSAFNMIEEAIWRRALERLPPGELPEGLGLVVTALAHGKNALGRAFVSMASQTPTPTLDLRSLFKGATGNGAAPPSPATRGLASRSGHDH